MVMRRCDVKTFTPASLMLVREEHTVPPSSASNQAPVRSFKVGEFGVATGGGIWVAARDQPEQIMAPLTGVMLSHRIVVSGRELHYV
jgi:hypothetical protein